MAFRNARSAIKIVHNDCQNSSLNTDGQTSIFQYWITREKVASLLTQCQTNVVYFNF